VKILKREDLELNNGNIIYENDEDWHHRICFGSPTVPSGGFYAPKYVGYNLKYGFNFPIDLDDEGGWIDLYNDKNIRFINDKEGKLVPDMRKFTNPSTSAPPCFFYNYKTDEFKLKLLPSDIEIANE